MGEYIKGIDVSHWSPSTAVSHANGEMQFAMIKATEGKSIVDNKMKRFARDAEDRGMCIGFYHYAHPELNSYADEAVNFLQQVEPYIGKCVLALDWEGKALYKKEYEEWALNWLAVVTERTGVKPMIYVQESALEHVSKIGKQDYGLWVAKWSSVKPKTGTFPFFAMWQYSEGLGKDFNKFNGTVEQLRKYAEVKR